MSQVRTAFAKELYHILCQSDIPVFVKMKTGGLDALTPQEAQRIPTVFEYVVKHFYDCGDLERRLSDYKDHCNFELVGKVLEEARAHAREIALVAKEYFANNF